MRKYLLNLRGILRHKWYVFVECWKFGIPFLGVAHDLSKLLPRELVAYSWSFHGPWPYKERPQWLVDDFDVAWLHHQNSNKHHWQYWMLTNMGREDRVLPMPARYRIEMLADWLAFSKARGKYTADALEKYLEAKEHIELHPDTREWIECALRVMAAADIESSTGLG